ncbi:uncharacterized protein PRCAT00004512001 [Priceomyces carsonii]|uniref:uncharacterized protein n=1 Tax=Priceomyces carsonii TaxID=28549 RepID=UPI002ED8F4C6|nr:unnamed protein product [Priceomyces carsonii]
MSNRGGPYIRRHKQTEQSNSDISGVQEHSSGPHSYNTTNERIDFPMFSTPGPLSATSPPRSKYDTDVNFLLSNQRESTTVGSNSNLDRAAYYPPQTSGGKEQFNLKQLRLELQFGINDNPIKGATSGTTGENDSDEDERFLRLAREALVATAKNASEHGSTVVDPTIQDLLQRLQYASSPHGNPISKSNLIQSNERGQLMIQDFYEQFPNFSNDIFMNDARPSPSSRPHQSLPNHPSNSNNQGWNFLVGQPLQLKEPAAEPQNAGGLTDLEQSDSQLLNETRKFLCKKCSMSFRRSSDLKRHEKQHLVIPPNICDRCGKGFARKDALKRHWGTLTCKRNAQKKLYSDNLDYLHQQKTS